MGRLLVAVALLLWSGATLAADGDLDSSFGTLGKVTTSLATFSSAADVAIQPDGKIVVVGTLLNAIGEAPAMVVLRYDSLGVLDPTFNGVGYATAGVDTFGGKGVAIAIQSDGRILVLGQSEQITHGASALFVMRYESNGLPDSTFGGDGMAEPTSLVASATDIALTETGEILVSFVGADASFNLYPSVLRLLSGGGLDSTFGDDGIATLPGFPLGGGPTIAFRPDGQIILGASNLMQISPVFVTAFAAGRLSATGDVDTSFGTGGISPAYGETVYVAGGASATALQSDNRIVLAGGTDGAFALVGMGANGGMDASFGSAGVFSDPFATHASDVLAHGGMFLAAGGNPQFALARVTPAGVLDATFGSGGRVTTDFGDPSSSAAAIAVQDNGAIVAVGTTQSSTASSIALARYLADPPGCMSGTDADDDGICDADDECPDGSDFSRARLVLTDLQLPSCDDRVLLNATLTLSSTADIDPDATGVRLLVRNGAGAIVLDETLPAGAYDEETQTGWRTRMSSGGATWRFSRPSTGGAMLSRAVLQRRVSTADTVKVLLKGHGVCFSAAPAVLPLTTTVVLTPPQAVDARCGDARFPGDPGPVCLIRSGGRKIACR